MKRFITMASVIMKTFLVTVMITEVTGILRQYPTDQICPVTINRRRSCSRDRLSLTLAMPVTAGPALTTTGRVGSARRLGPG
jgi:hypothetical protein